MKPLSTTHKEQLLAHLLEEKYISDESKFEQFIDAISDTWFSALLDDMTYTYEPFKSYYPQDEE